MDRGPNSYVLLVWTIRKKMPCLHTTTTTITANDEAYNNRI